MTAADFEVCRVTFFLILQVAELRSSLVAVVVAHSSCGLLSRPSGLVKRCCLYLAFILIYRNAFFIYLFLLVFGEGALSYEVLSFSFAPLYLQALFFFTFTICQLIVASQKSCCCQICRPFFFVVVVVCNRCTSIFLFFFSLSYSGFVIAKTKERLHKSRNKKRKSSHA